MKRYNYLTNCVDCGDGKAITDLVESAKPISYKTMLNECVGLIDWALSVGYSPNKREGLTLQNDFHVGYFRGTYKGESVLFLTWSAIEWIWSRTPEGDVHVGRERIKDATKAGDRIAHPKKRAARIVSRAPYFNS